MTIESRRLAGVILAAVVLAGCAKEQSSPEPGTGLDGRWIGYFESSLGLLGCPGRGPMAIEVDKGWIAGSAEGNGFVMAVSGLLGPNGAVQDGVFRRDDRAAAIVTGTFLADSAAGRWQGASCEGIWTLRHVPR